MHKLKKTGYVGYTAQHSDCIVTQDLVTVIDFKIEGSIQAVKLNLFLILWHFISN